jgi:hypothetical protein
MNEIISWLVANPDHTNAIAAVISAILAFVALIIAALSIYLAWRTLHNQVKHNKLSVRPVPFIALSKRDGFSVQLENHGFGPLKIDLFEIIRSGSVLQNITSIIPEGPPVGVTVSFTTGMFERTIPANEHVEIMNVVIISANHDAISYMGQCKINLCDTKIRIGYSDMYGERFGVYEKDLSWLCN